MELLAQLHPLLPARPGNSCSQIRRLWPFLRHNLAPVRQAAVQLLISLVEPKPGTRKSCNPC